MAQPGTTRRERSQTFRTLHEPNARRFFVGLLVSNIGTWVQATVLVLLVRELGGTGVELGIVAGLQFFPLLVLGLWAGAFADRHNRRRLTIVTQAALGLQAIALGVVDLAGWESLPLVYTLSLVFGLLSAFDNPARRGLVTELVGPDDLANALSLNTAVMTGSRIFGPALGALGAAAIGTGWCFVLNGVSFLAMLLALVRIRIGRLHAAPIAARSGTPVRDGLRVVWRDPVLRTTLIVFTVVSAFAFNYSVSLPLVVTNLGAPDSMFGTLLSVTSIGSVIGSLAVARQVHIGREWLFGSLGLLIVSGLALAFAPTVWFAYVVGVPLGAGGASFIAAANVVFQQRTPPDMRSRVLALTAVAFLGSTPIGGPITGAIGDTFGAEWSLAYGSLVAGAALAYGIARVRTMDARRGGAGTAGAVPSER